MPSVDLFETLDALDRGDPLPDFAALFPHLHSSGGPFIATVDVGWTAMVLRLLARLDATAGAAGATLSIMQVKEKFGLLRVYLDLGGSDRTLRDRCETLVAEAEAESAHRCQRCGARGELAPDRSYLAVLCARHQENSRARPAMRPGPTLSAHARLRLARLLGAGDWREVQPPHGGALLRARIVDGDVAFAISLRAEPGDAAAPLVVAAALTQADGSVLTLPTHELMDREADLAARVAAELRG